MTLHPIVVVLAAIPCFAWAAPQTLETSASFAWLQLLVGALVIAALARLVWASK